MTESFAKRLPGDRHQPSAALHNATVDMVTRYRMRQLNSGTDNALIPTTQSTLVRVMNNTGGNLPAHAIVALSNSVFGTMDQGWQESTPLLAAVAPPGDSSKVIGVLLNALPNGMIGLATISGFARCTVDWQTHPGSGSPSPMTPLMASNGTTGLIANGITLAGAPPVAYAITFPSTWSPTNWEWVVFLGTSPPAMPGFFPVTMTNDGGINGTNTTAATYTYTLKSLNGMTTLGTAKPQIMPRSVGAVTVRPSGSIGEAYMDASNVIQLWNAGEPYDTDATCSS